MNARKFFRGLALALVGAALHGDDLQAGPRKRRADSPISTAVPSSPQTPIESRANPPAPPSAIVVIPATGETLKQPNVTLFRGLVMRQRLEDLLKPAPAPR